MTNNDNGNCSDHGHDHQHEHNHGHHHDHHQSEMSDKEKLKVLIAHWIKHNTEHKESLEEWACKAKESGGDAIAAALEKSAELMEKSVDELRVAQSLFGNSSDCEAGAS